MKISNLILIAFLAISLNAEENFDKKGWFGGIGVGFLKPAKTQITPLMSLEAGYVVNDKVAVHISEDGYIIKNTIVALDSLGLSYYIDNKNYIKASYGLATLVVSDVSLPSISFGSGFSVGYGYGISEKSSLELSYGESNIIRTMPTQRIQYELSTISIMYRYRFF